MAITLASGAILAPVDQTANESLRSHRLVVHFDTWMHVGSRAPSLHLLPPL